MEPRLIEKYRVGGDIKTQGAHETRWQFENHEIRVRVRRGNWQYHMSANARITAEYDPGLKMFPEWLDVRCPTMTDDQLPAVTAWMKQVLNDDDDHRTFFVSNKKYLPRKKEFVGTSSRYIAFTSDIGKPQRVQSWTN